MKIIQQIRGQAAMTIATLANRKQ